MTRYNWQLILLFSAMALIVSACSPKQYTETDLKELNAKTVKGVVTKQSRGSFIVKDKAGEEFLLNTGQSTQYIPALYRSQINDEVRVTFHESWRSNGQLLRAVLQLESIYVPEDNLAPSEPLNGTIVAIQKGSTKYETSIILQTKSKEDPYLIYIPKTNNVLKVNGKIISFSSSHYTNSRKSYPFADLIGGETQVSIKHAPILRGNAYVFEAVEIEVTKKLDQ